MLPSSATQRVGLMITMPSTRRCPSFSTKSNRKQVFPFDAEHYRLRNVNEPTFCRLKDFRRIATRYDRLATNFLAAICIAATVSYWL